MINTTRNYESGICNVAIANTPDRHKVASEKGCFLEGYFINLCFVVFNASKESWTKSAVLKEKKKKSNNTTLFIMTDLIILYMIMTW